MQVSCVFPGTEGSSRLKASSRVCSTLQLVLKTNDALPNSDVCMWSDSIDHFCIVSCSRKWHWHLRWCVLRLLYDNLVASERRDAYRYSIFWTRDGFILFQSSFRKTSGNLVINTETCLKISWSFQYVNIETSVVLSTLISSRSGPPPACKYVRSLKMFSYVIVSSISSVQSPRMVSVICPQKLWFLYNR